LLERVTAKYQHWVESRGICLSVDVDLNLSERRIDLERMEHVLGNLDNNALNYTPEGGKIHLNTE
jgi:signal transduction histidine kinase